MTREILIKANFILDAYIEDIFEGYTKGEEWNGFECPLFTLDSAQHIVEVVGRDQTALYDEAADEFIFAEEDCEDGPDRYGAVEVEGIGKLYPIGSRVWIWGKL